MDVTKILKKVREVATELWKWKYPIAILLILIFLMSFFQLGRCSRGSEVAQGEGWSAGVQNTLDNNIREVHHAIMAKSTSDLINLANGYGAEWMRSTTLEGGTESGGGN
jgi:hypothetical protein